MLWFMPLFFFLSFPPFPQIVCVWAQMDRAWLVWDKAHVTSILTLSVWVCAHSHMHTRTCAIKRLCMEGQKHFSSLKPPVDVRLLTERTMQSVKECEWPSAEATLSPLNPFRTRTHTNTHACTDTHTLCPYVSFLFFHSLVSLSECCHWRLPSERSSVF